MSRASNAITFALLIFLILFISAWHSYAHIRQDRMQWHPSRFQDVELLEFQDEEEYMNIQQQQPFRPREYIRINNWEKEV